MKTNQKYDFNRLNHKNDQNLHSIYIKLKDKVL